MYLDAHPIQNGVTSLKMHSIVESKVSSSEIFTQDERFLGIPPKEVLYLDIGIAKYSQISRTVFAGAQQSPNVHSKCYSFVMKAKKMLWCFMQA